MGGDIGFQILSSGGGVGYTINGNYVQYGAYFQLGNSQSYFKLHLVLDASRSDLWWAYSEPERTFDPNTATWHKI